MSGGGVSRVSIPKSVSKTIQDIKEIAQNHSDEEIYAMLKECSMDPNETAQKLLLQDTFHEVKRKRDKRKENLNNRETADSRWRPGTQGRGGRGGRGNFPPRHTSHDAGSGRNANAGKENGVNQKPESVVTTASVPATLDADNKGPTPMSSSATGMANEPPNAGSSTQSHSYSPEEPAHVSASMLADTPQPPPPLHVEAKSAPSSGLNVTHGKHTPSADQVASPVSVLGVYSSASDPVLVPSLDSRLPAAVGTIKREVRSQRTGAEPHSSVHAESKSAATQDFTKLFQTNKVVPQAVTNSELPSVNEKAAPEIGNSFRKLPSRYQGFEKNQASESLQPPSSSSHDGSSTSRPSSNYGSRSQQPIGSQKVGPSKEWKPKPTNQSSTPASGTTVTSEMGAIIIEAGVGSLPKFDSSVSEESKSNLQHKLEELQLSHSQHVIIPNHLQVSESERTRLSFGSFDADFGVKTSYVNEPETDKCPTPLSESSQGVDEASEEPPSSNQNTPPNAREGDYPDNPQSPVNVAKNLSPVEADVPSGAVPEFDQSNKSEAVLPQGASQYSIVHTTPNYNFGLMPTVLGTQFAPFDSSEPQARDVSRLPSFVVPQYDPSSYYTQLFRPSTDGDGRYSPFLAPGAVSKYNGNVAASSPQSGQPSQESGNSLVLSTAGPTPLVTQAAGVMQNSLAVTQPTVTFFRQPSGVNFPPYHPNYMPPFSQYIPPFYSLPTFHPFLSNTAFPQQNPGNVYQPPAAAASSGVKYPYKPGTNTSNSTHVGTPTGYPQYNSSPTGYSPNPAASTGNSTGNEDLSASQFKENNVYISGQQSEGSTVWIPTPCREVSGLQPNSFYNPSPHAQHVTYAPTQAGHGAYAGMYHPAQTVAAGAPHPLLQQSQTMAGPVEMVGPPGGLYQQPQRAQMNWTGNY